MASFRILNPFQVFLNADATAPAKFGRFEFFEAGTTDPKSVFGDPALTIDNGSEVTLGADGRLTVETWGSGAYRVRQYDANGSLVQEADNVRGDGGAGATLPPMEAGAFITTDGAQWLMDFISQLPDMSGQGGKALFTDGANAIWQTLNIPPPVAPDIVITSTGAWGAPGAVRSLRVGIASSPTKVLLQAGTGQAPASGQRQSNVSVNYPVGFAELWWAGLTVTSAALTSSGIIAVHALPTANEAGFAAQFDSNDFGNNNGRFINPIPFRWLAVGLVTVA
ncbi:hypothetical protein [Lysobacter sp. Hz 25]|uniref:hypothetical protein n=1 Tax=Lysobacter sp. Hz 25 TaxID=3383698 RepID=UPI0038D41259